eukprot:2666746-Rhodomonas_salina.1
MPPDDGREQNTLPRQHEDTDHCVRIFCRHWLCQRAAAALRCTSTNESQTTVCVHCRPKACAPISSRCVTSDQQVIPVGELMLGQTPESSAEQSASKEGSPSC